MKLKSLASMSLACLFAGAAFAQVTVPVGTGSETGSYFKFISQAALVCQQDVRISNRKSAGSTENLDLMEANEVSLGISQLDILDLYKRTRDMSSIKLLAPLFPEQIHFVARADLTKIEGQKTFMGMAVPGTGTKVQLQTAQDLAGKRVGAAGGSLKTAQLISILSGIPMNIQDTGSPDQALAQVIAGTLDAAILVGAQPLGTLTNLKGNIGQVRLLPVPEAMAAKLSSVYGKSQPLTYRAMGAGGDSVPTVQVMSALVTQNYPKSAMGDAVYSFQQCLLREAPVQATVPGNHPAWRNLRVTSGLNWDAWQYQGATTTPVRSVKK
jgi:TRAP-type uncharacterized transport system substrate-binding protein